MISDALFQKYYSDPKYSCTANFYSMLRGASGTTSRVLNFGAGPGTQSTICTLKGEVAEVVGADIDDVVLRNPEVDTAVVIKGDRLPFEDQSFDLAYSDYVLEHVERPLTFLREVCRILKPGTSYFFRTPSIYHYVTLISRFTPHWMHSRLANRMRGLSEQAHEPWPTFYRMNSRRAIRRAALEARFKTINLRMVEGHPSYLMFHPVPFLAGVAYERLVNSNDVFAGLRSNIFGRLTK